MKPMLIIVAAIFAVIITIVVGKNVVSHMHEEYEVTGDAGTSLEAKNKDIEKLNKEIEKRKDETYEESRRRGNYNQLEQASVDARMNVSDFREEPNDSTLRSVTGMPSAASKWQNWVYLLLIALGVWMVFSRLRSK